MVLRLVDTGSGKYGQWITNGSPSLVNIFGNQTSTPLDAPPPFFTGDMPLTFPYNARSAQDLSDFYIQVQQNDPAPMTVAGIFPSYEVEEWQ